MVQNIKNVEILYFQIYLTFLWKNLFIKKREVLLKNSNKRQCVEKFVCEKNKFFG